MSSVVSLYHHDPRSRTVELIYVNVSIKFSERGANQIETNQSKGKSRVTWDNEIQEQIQNAIEKLVMKNKKRVSAAVLE